MPTQSVIINTLKIYFKEASLIYKIKMAFLYGSWAKGFPKSFSEENVAIVFLEEPGGYKTCLNLIMPEAGSRNPFNLLRGELRNRVSPSWKRRIEGGVFFELFYNPLAPFLRGIFSLPHQEPA